MRPKGLIAVALLFCAFSRSAATAAGITLDLHQVTLQQAAAALAQASGERIRIPAPATPGPAAAPEVRDFRWKEITFSQALRDLCTVFHSHCVRFPSDYAFFPQRADTVDPPLASPQGSPAFRSADGTVFLTAAEWTKPGAVNPWAPWPALRLNLMAMFDNLDSQAVTGLENVVAKDDRGNLLTCQSLLVGGFFHVPPSPFPDQWVGKADLLYPDLKARKLEWVRGDLMGYHRYATQQWELPWATGAPGANRKLGRFQVQAQCYSPESGPEHGTPAGGPSLEIRVSGSYQGKWQDKLYAFDAELVGASGRTYKPSSPWVGDYSKNGQQSWITDLDFPPISERVVKARVTFRDAGERTRLLAFRLTNIQIPPPLPGASDALPATSPVAAPPSPAPRKITLDLRGLSATEAVAALNRIGGGRRLTLVTPPQRDGLGDEVRSSFHWKDASFSRAFREVCDAFRLTWERDAFGFVLRQQPPGAGAVLPAPGGRGQPPAPVGPPAFENQSLRMFRPVPVWNTSLFGGIPQLRLDLRCELEDLDAGEIVGLTNVIARDDRGNLIACFDPDNVFPVQTDSTPLQDQWTGRLKFSLPDLHAQKLVSIEGDLMGRRDAVLELPFQVGAPGVRETVYSREFEVECHPALPPVNPGGPDKGPSVEIRWDKRTRNGPDFEVELVGASGEVYHPNENRVSPVRQDLTFRPIAETVATVRVLVQPPGVPVPLFKFRLADITLPPPPVPRPLLAPLPAVLRGIAGQPAPGVLAGGTLVFSVLLEKEPAPRGRVSVGLSQWLGNRWTAVRWQDVEIGEGGSGFLRDVPAGRYRVLRRYRPRQPSPKLAFGKWCNNTATVTVLKGKSISLSPLQWRSDP